MVFFSSSIVFSSVWMRSLHRHRMLQQLVASLQRQLDDSNRKVDALLSEVAGLKELLVRKAGEEQKQRNIVKGLSKIMQNKSERQTPARPPSTFSSYGQTWMRKGLRGRKIRCTFAAEKTINYEQQQTPNNHSSYESQTTAQRIYPVGKA